MDRVLPKIPKKASEPTVNIDRVDASPISIETANCYCDVRIKTEPVVPTAPSNEIGDSDDINAHIPTEHEQTTLRRVAGPLPKSAFLVAVVELCERFAYYGIAGPFQNYIENPYKPGNPTPGALGRGQSAASGLTSFFQFWCFITPIIGGVIADQYLGRYLTIVLSAVVYVVGLVILVCTSLPTAILHNAAFGGLIAAMIIIGLGTGGIKANISPLIAEQVKFKKAFVKTLKSGEKVIEDPARTVERIYMIFYMCINLGALGSIATTQLEKHVDFWAAYLLPMCMFLVAFVVTILGRRYYIVRAPKGSVIPQALRIFWIGIKNKGKLDSAKPSYQISRGNQAHGFPWSDRFVDEMKRALVGCKVFLYYPIYWVCQQQMLNNLVSQAGTMELHGIPNDIMQSIDPLAIIIFVPIVDRIVYPVLRKLGIPMRPISRITTGFFLASIAMIYAAVLQHIIYTKPPCFLYPKKCPASNDGELGNKIHVAIQTPAYLFIGLSEIFSSVTGLEYAYTKAPASMKSFVTSLFLLTTALGAALGMAISPVAKNPKLVWMYAGLAVASAIAGAIFWFLYHQFDAKEDDMNALEATQEEEEKPVAATEFTITRHGAERV